MNNSPSLNEINKTASMDPNLLTRHYKLKLMNDFMYVKYQNSKMKQSDIANNLNMSSSTIQRFRNDINKLSPYRINPNNNKKRPKKAKIDNISDLKRPQMTSNDSIKNKKTILKGGSVQDDIEIIEHYLDKILKKQ